MAVSYKDEEIVQLHERIAELQKQLQAARMDTDKNAMAELILVSAFFLDVIVAQTIASKHPACVVQQLPSSSLKSIS